MKLYKVGGCVRDKYLGIESKDIDFSFVLDDLNQSVEEGYNQMKQYLTDNKFEIFLLTPDMFTIRARFPTDHKYTGLVADFVMARKEIGYLEGTRRPILVLGTLEDDLIRRDFTLNAMALDENEELIDLFDGMSDLQKKVLRTPLLAHITLLDDPLRMLRALRFSITKGFTIHPDIYEAMKDKLILDKMLNVVSGERIMEEIKKMMSYDTVRSIKLLNQIDQYNNGFLDLIFDKGLWLKPTFEKVK